MKYELKICNRCQQEKPTNKFPKNKRTNTNNGAVYETIYPKCNKCLYAEKRNQFIVRQEKFRLSNKEKIKQYRIKYYSDVPEAYVKQKLIKSGFPSELITNELIETKRIIIKTKRLCKTLQS